MLILIDESGDTGFKRGSSRFFVMTMVVFDDKCEKGNYPSAEHTSNTISEIKTKIGHKPEFHFSKCSHKVRNSFFTGLNTNSCEFQVFSLVVDKEKIYSGHLQTNTKNFYNFILKNLLAYNPIHNANIKIDGSKSKAFSRSLSNYLKQHKDGMIINLKFKDSKNDNLIQLADMCCSAIAYKYNRSDKIASDSYIKLIGKRIINIWEFQ